MEIWTKPQDVPKDLHSALTIGIFDGVHRGHAEILAQTVEAARAANLRAVVLTFSPHPASVHHPERHLHLITALPERLRLLEKAGIDAVYIQHYDLDYASTDPEDFISSQLCGLLKAKVVVVGRDARFGKNNSGDWQLLEKLSEKQGFKLHLVDDIGGVQAARWSSTVVRELLAAGKVAAAAQILGRPHRVRGIVQHGNKRGRLLGFPTANLAGDDLGEIPADGVYAGWVVENVDTEAEVKYPAAISVGSNPHFHGENRTVEAHILGRGDLHLYGKEIAVEFIAYLRSMQAFAGIAELQAQMDADIAQSAQILGVPDTGRIDPGIVTAQ
ncbi:MAG: bifunctional riboflavin kinase/FAD synthetase [Actinomycetaceae bacterium]|nr:bifunctional riboflavin kinase/FAD synthetase [Actinomycetaceae bacterium]